MVATTDQVKALRSYLQAIQLGPNHRELALDREALLSQLDERALATDVTRWEAAKAFFDWFQERYHQAYAAHHRHYQQRLRETQGAWEEVERQLSALAQLNQLAELGRPVGAGLFEAGDRLAARMTPCSSQAPQKEEPLCPQCHLQLGASPPRDELAALRERVRRALLTQQRRLSREAVKRVLAQSGQPQLDRLLRAARAADLADLVSLMDKEMVAFLRQFLAVEPLYASPAAASRPLRDPSPAREAPVSGAGLLAALRQRFPTITESQVDEVSRELARLLREALAQAQAGPGERVDLRLE